MTRPKPIEPKLRESDLGRKFYTHPSYGVIYVSRVSGTADLFGSNLKHHHYIRLTIARAEDVRGETGHQDTFGRIGRGELIDINMSETQWGQLLSSMGMGGGVQCTLRYVNGEEQAPCPESHIGELHHDAMKAIGEEIVQELEALHERVKERLENPKPMNKGETREFLNDIRSAVALVSGKLPYVQTTMQERLEEQVASAKTEIDSFLQYKAQLLGLKTVGVKGLLDAGPEREEERKNVQAQAD